MFLDLPRKYHGNEHSRLYTFQASIELEVLQDLVPD